MIWRLINFLRSEQEVVSIKIFSLILFIFVQWSIIRWLKFNQRKHTPLEEKRKPVNILWRQNLINNIKGFANVAKS